MPSKQTNRTETLIAVGQTGFGIVLATAAVTLWVAWSPFVFLVVVVAIGVSAGIFILLHDFEQPASEARLESAADPSFAV
jgi:urea transporter